MTTEVDAAKALVSVAEGVGLILSPSYFAPLDRTPETTRDGQFTVVAQSRGPVQVSPGCMTTPETFDIVIDFVARNRAPQDWWRTEVSPRIQSLIDALVDLYMVNSVSGRYLAAVDALVLTAIVTVVVEHDRSR